MRKYSLVFFRSKERHKSELLEASVRRTGIFAEKTMASGPPEVRLTRNLHDQLTRLLTQLSDLDDLRQDLDEQEYEQTKADTLQQLQEFEETLARVAGGNTALVDTVSKMRSELQAAIGEAFKTPEVMKMFASKQPDQLREHLASIKMKLKSGKLQKEQADQEIIRILRLLEKLGEPLEDADKAYLKHHSGKSTDDFEVTDHMADGTYETRIMAMASSDS